MADQRVNAAGNSSFRFFSSEQIDQILCEGARRGRAGSHRAIERILKHEPAVGRADLWRRIRRLKQPRREEPHQQTFWAPEDDEILRNGYGKGWKGKREAVRELLRRHSGWRAHSIWKRAATLGLVARAPGEHRQRSRQPWTDEEERILLTMAGYKTARFIARTLSRSESAVRYRLAVLGKSSRVHLEGYARRTLARELHLGSRTVQRLIAVGLLEVRDPRITRQSLDEAVKTGRLTEPANDQRPGIPENGFSPGHEEDAVKRTNDFPFAGPGELPKLPRACRARKIWSDLAMQLGVGAAQIEHLVFLGVLKLQDSRITEESLARFCARYGALIQTEVLDPETRGWLVGSMDLAPNSGKAVAQEMEGFRKHARVLRTCGQCGRIIRGNVFFRHLRSCPKQKASPAESGGSRNVTAGMNPDKAHFRRASR